MEDRWEITDYMTCGLMAMYTTIQGFSGRGGYLRTTEQSSMNSNLSSRKVTYNEPIGLCREEVGVERCISHRTFTWGFVVLKIKMNLLHSQMSILLFRWLIQPIAFRCALKIGFNLNTCYRLCLLRFSVRKVTEGAWYKQKDCNK